MMVLVSYDVSIDNNGQGRLRRVSKLCQNYGQRVQKSVFECIVDPGQWTLFKAGLIKIIDKKRDSLRFYFLGSNWRRRVEHIGLENTFDQEGPLII